MVLRYDPYLLKKVWNHTFKGMVCKGLLGTTRWVLELATAENLCVVFLGGE